MKIIKKVFGFIFDPLSFLFNINVEKGNDYLKAHILIAALVTLLFVTGIMAFYYLVLQ